MTKRRVGRYGRSAEYGGSLMSIVIGTVIIGIVSIVLAKTYTFNAKTMTDVQRRNDYEDARRWLAISLSCPNTLAAMGGSCPGGAAEIALYGTTAPSVPKGPAYRTIGKYTLRATCSGNAPMTIFVTIRETQPVGAWDNLFSDVPIQC